MEIIDFKEANCRNCYKCVRICPVNAIKISNDQANIVDNLCVNCGECLKICPQNAKSIKSELELIKSWIKKEKLIASLAPSFPSGFNVSDPLKIIRALEILGFEEVRETSEGAIRVSNAYIKDFNSDKKHVITSCCPTVNQLIQKYYKNHIKYLSPVVSPMQEHCQILKHEDENAKVIFIGPCLSKKIEQINYSSVDAVLTFDELNEWFVAEKINLNDLIVENLSTKYTSSSRWYPLSGGIEKNMKISENSCREIIKIDGIDRCIDILDNLHNLEDSTWIEMNACVEGCINGPGNLLSPFSTYQKIEKVKSYIHSFDNSEDENIDLEAASNIFEPIDLEYCKEYDDDQITKILIATGKHYVEDELNCGACGYNTCREKAVGILNGMAEIDMCIPYMLNKSEDISNIIISSTPNAIVVLDSNFKIIEYNTSAENLFKTSRKEAIGNTIDKILGKNVFLTIKKSNRNFVCSKIDFEKLDLKMKQTLKYLPRHDVYLGIFTDITDSENNRNKIEMMQKNTLDMAQDVIDKQMRVAHEIASLLGETTAETKVTLTSLQKLVNAKDEV